MDAHSSTIAHNPRVLSGKEALAASYAIAKETGSESRIGNKPKVTASDTPVDPYKPLKMNGSLQKAHKLAVSNVPNNTGGKAVKTADASGMTSQMITVTGALWYQGISALEEPEPVRRLKSSRLGVLVSYGASIFLFPSGQVFYDTISNV
jgi:hypothetical protein